MQGQVVVAAMQTLDGTVDADCHGKHLQGPNLPADNPNVPVSAWQSNVYLLIYFISILPAACTATSV